MQYIIAVHLNSDKFIYQNATHNLDGHFMTSYRKIQGTNFKNNSFYILSNIWILILPCTTGACVCASTTGGASVGSGSRAGNPNSSTSVGTGTISAVTGCQVIKCVELNS